MPARGRRPGRARGSRQRGGRGAAQGHEGVENNPADNEGAAQGHKKIENNPADNGGVAQGHERAENNGAEDGLARILRFLSTLLSRPGWRRIFCYFIIWLSVTLMEHFSDHTLFTNYQNIGMWTNRIQKEILCGVVLGVYKACGTGDVGDFIKWGGCCFLVLRFGGLGVQSLTDRFVPSSR